MLLGVVAAVFVATVVAGRGGRHAGRGTCRRPPRRPWWAAWPTGSRWWRCSATRSGVPIPHTAIITARKEQFGETLGDFIQSSFLTPDAVAERVQAARVGERVSRWLSDPANADEAGRPRCSAAPWRWSTCSRTRPSTTSWSALLRERIESASIVPMAGRALGALTKEGRHTEVVDSALRGLDRYLDEHRDELRNRFRDQAPWWLPGAVEDRIFERLLDGVRAVLDDMAHDQGHGLRRQLDARILRFVDELQTSPTLRAKGEQLTRDLLQRPELRDWVASVWTDAKAYAARPGRRPGVGAAHAAGRGHRRRWATGSTPSRPWPPRSTTPPRRPPATSSSTSAARSPSWCRARSPAGTARRPRSASSCSSAPTSSSSASTARSSAAWPASALHAIAQGAGLTADRSVSRPPRTTYSLLQDIERRAGELFREIGMPEIADDEPLRRRPPRVGGRPVHRHRRRRPADRLRPGRPRGRPRPPRTALGGPGVRRPGDRHRADRRRRRLGEGRGDAEVTLTTFRDVAFNAPAVRQARVRRASPRPTGRTACGRWSPRRRPPASTSRSGS